MFLLRVEELQATCDEQEKELESKGAKFQEVERHLVSIFETCYPPNHSRSAE